MFFFFFFFDYAQVVAQLWREGIKGAGQRLAKSEESSWEEKAQKVRLDRTVRKEGEGNKGSQPGWVEKVKERVTVFW